MIFVRNEKLYGVKLFAYKCTLFKILKNIRRCLCNYGCMLFSVDFKYLSLELEDTGVWGGSFGGNEI